MREINEEIQLNAEARFRVLPFNQIGTFPNSTTPSVENVEYFNAGGWTVTITNFLYGKPGQKLWILGDGKASVAHNANIETTAGAGHLLLNGEMYLFIFMGNKWRELEVKPSGTTGLFFNPYDYGAVGDGVANDTLAIQATYAAAIAAKGVVLIERPSNYYAVNGTIAVNGPVTTLAFNLPQLRFSNNAIAGFDITSSDVEFDGIYAKGRQYLAASVFEDCFRIHGASSAAYIRNIKIKNCKIEQWGFYGIYSEFTENFEFNNNDLDNIHYAGIALISAQYGNVEYNDINTIADPGPGHGYGIACTRYSITSLVTSPRSKRIRVANNRVYNVPIWEAYDTHAGEDILFINNYSYNCKWGLNIGPCPDSLGVPAYAPINCHAINNTFESGVVGSANAGIVYTGAGISLGVVAEYATGGIIAGNTIIGYGDQNNSLSAAILFYATKGTKVYGNQCMEPANCGIMAYVDNDDFTIHDNTITDVWSNVFINPSAVWVRANNNNGYVADNRMARSTKVATDVNAIGLQVAAVGGVKIRCGYNDFWNATDYVYLDSGKNIVSPNVMELGADIGDANGSITPGSSRSYQISATNLTANRTTTIQLTPTALNTGWHFVRTSGGAFDWIIADTAVGTVCRLRKNEWAIVMYDNGQTKLIARGVLDQESPQGWHNIKHFGALVDGATDDTNAVLAAINSAASSGAVVYIPHGTTIVSGLTKAGLAEQVTIRGSGRESSIIKQKANAVLPIMQFTTGSKPVYFCDVGFDGNSGSQVNFNDLITLDGSSGASLEADRIRVLLWNARLFNLTNISRARIWDLTARFANETTDAQLAGGCGVLYMPSSTGSIDFRSWDCRHPAPTDTRYAPYAMNIQAPSGQSMAGVIEGMYFVNYGHQSAGANPLGAIDVYNYGADLQIKNINSRTPTFCAIKVANCSRISIDTVNIYSQNHNFGSFAIQVGAGVHGVAGDFPAPSITNIKAQSFTAAHVIQIAGSAGSEIKNPRIQLDARNCFGGVSFDYVEGADVDIILRNSTGTVTTSSGLYIPNNCEGHFKLALDIENSAIYPVYIDSTLVDVSVVPGSRIYNDGAFESIRAANVRHVNIDGMAFEGTRAQFLWLVNAASIRLKNNRSDVATPTLVLTGSTKIDIRENSWQTVTARNATGTINIWEDVTSSDCTAGNIILTLPPAADVPLMTFIVKRINAGANTITVDGNGAETIDGAANVVLAAQWAIFKARSNGTNWYSI